jgi:hypothetical protein
MKALAALALALAACTSSTGTVRVSLITAPGSHLLDAVQTLRVTLTQPRKVIEATRSSTGFDLALEFDAVTDSGALIVEGLDAAGTLVACGQSPRFPVTGISARVSVYLAAPRTIAISPVALAAPRTEIAVAALPYGAVIAGGAESASAASTSIAIYNAYVHELDEGVPLPAARSGMAIAIGAGGGVYLFGGAGSDGVPVGTLWRFDTTVPQHGKLDAIADQPSFARSGQLLVPIGTEHFLITGTPALELTSGMVMARSDIAELPATGAAATGDATPTAVFSGAALVRFRGGSFDTLPGGGRGHAVATKLPDGRIAVLGGAPGGRDALVIDGATGAVTTVSNALSQERRDPVVATTSRHVVVAGGVDDAGRIASADVLDATSLALLATLPVVPRPGGFAIALPNDQVLLGGGAASLELFTPEPP